MCEVLILHSDVCVCVYGLLTGSYVFRAKHSQEVFENGVFRSDKSRGKKLQF